jgi:hypothetical protein
MATVRSGCDRVQLSIPSDLLRRIDLDAFSKQQPRAHWLIEAAEGHLADPSGGRCPKAISPALYGALIEHAARTSSGIPRTQLEAIVASVIVKLHEAPADA